jgi:hypothetical protein
MMELSVGTRPWRQGRHTSRPLPLCNIWAPFLPVSGTLAIFFQSLFFLGEVFVFIDQDHGWGDLQSKWKREERKRGICRRHKGLDQPTRHARCIYYILEFQSSWAGGEEMVANLRQAVVIRKS